MDGPVMIEELTDYALVKYNQKEKQKKKVKRKKFVEKIQEDDTEKVPITANNCKLLKKKSKKKICQTIAGNPNEQLVKKKRKKNKKQTIGKDELEEGSSKEDACHKSILEKSDMSAWNNLYVPEEVLAALADNDFTAPTPIQALVLPSAIRDKKDIVGAAETGSGKTLAFGIPLIHHIMQMKEEHAVNQEPELVQLEPHWDDIEEQINQGDTDLDNESGSDDDHNLTPTHEELEELQEDGFGCVYVDDNVTFDWPEESGLDLREIKPIISKPLLALVLCPTRELAMQVKNHLTNAAKFTDIRIAAIVGGMAVQKQTRLLKHAPEVVVATPGRLWELYEEGEPHLQQINKIKLLVIDEADRMVEKGHFQELTKLLGQINSDKTNRQQRQTFVFSATLTFVPSSVQKNVLNKKKKKKELTSEQKLERLMEEIGIRMKPKVIDLTKKGASTAETLVEAKINCSLEEKDVYLYYFLKQYPSRTLVFTNSKDCIRRLVSIFTLLETCPLPLHGDMHQKQRLKNLDRFKDNPKSLLLATDVAARGLDIPNVEHVIHYQVPRTIENYVHRSGRTARAYKEGLSVMLVSPDDLHNYRKICKTVNRDEDLPLFPVEQEYIPAIKARVNMARSIDKQELKVTKVQKQNRWFEKAAKEMDIEIDEDMLLEDMGNSREQAEKRDKLRMSKLQLKSILKQPLLTKNYSGKYITKMGKLSLPYLKETTMKGALKAVKDEKNIKKFTKSLPTGVKRLTKAKSKKKRRH